MQEIRSLLEKITRYSKQNTLSSIEKDMMMSYTRTLYECLMELETEKETPKEVFKEDKSAASETVGQYAAETPEQPTAQTAGEKVQNESSKDETISVKDHKPEHPAPTAINEASEEIPAPEDQPASTADIPEQELPETVIPDLEIEWHEPETFELEPELAAEQRFSSAAGLNDMKAWNKDIRSYIGINDKYNFISELFGGNAEAYEEILNELNQCETKDDARLFLERSGITTLYKWKDDGFSENIFYNVLGQFFSAR
jgi:hypothetical protein